VEKNNRLEKRKRVVNLRVRGRNLHGKRNQIQIKHPLRAYLCNETKKGIRKSHPARLIQGGGIGKRGNCRRTVGKKQKGGRCAATQGRRLLFLRGINCDRKRDFLSNRRGRELYPARSKTKNKDQT